MSMTEWRSPADLRGTSAPPIAAADRVRADDNLHPHYQIIALGEDRAWIRDLSCGTDHLIPIDGSRHLPPERQEPPCN